MVDRQTCRQTQTDRQTDRQTDSGPPCAVPGAELKIFCPLRFIFDALTARG